MLDINTAAASSYAGSVSTKKIMQILKTPV
jgi:hypothetical protein